MKLSTSELAWVEARFQYYDIKFIEIRNELLDHIIMAIEARRAAGDEGSLESQFNDVADKQFGGFQGIELLVEEQKKLYRKLINRTFWQGFRHYLNWQMAVFAIALLYISYYLPLTKTVTACFMAAILLMVFSSFVYGQFSAFKAIKLKRGEQSLVKSYVISQVTLPMMFLNGIIYLPNILLADNEAGSFKAIKLVPPIALAFVLLFFLIVNLSCIRLCKQVLKVS